MKIVTIVGCRPQFIKAAVVSREIAKHEDIEEIIVHTGQHYDDNMSSVFFEQLDIPEPRYNLDVNKGPTGKMIGQMIATIEAVLQAELPHYVIVYGDTNSTLAGAIAANKCNIKVVHIEAGLRDRDRSLPEEINRILTDNISDLLLCPTAEACSNLRNENIHHWDSIQFVGDVMYDSVLHYKDDLVKHEGGFILCTIHRQHNMKHLDTTLKFLEEQENVVLVAHPRVKDFFKKSGENIRVIEAVDYLTMLSLVQACEMVITDSGGLQKEASFLKKKCLVLNKTTGWNELVIDGCNMLIEEMSIQHLRDTLSILKAREVVFDTNHYGDGKAGEAIIHSIKRDYDRSNGGATFI